MFDNKNNLFQCPKDSKTCCEYAQCEEVGLDNLVYIFCTNTHCEKFQNSNKAIILERKENDE